MAYLGIDGGGTKTTCLVTDKNFKEIARVVGSSINYYSEGLEKARKNMKSMIDEITERTGISHFDSVFIGMSALFTKAENKELHDFCDGIFKCDKIGMNSDLFIALKASEKENVLVAIAGTGSMAAGLGKNGEVLTKGGFGYILGDEGSGYAIALQAIQSAVRSLDKTGEKTELGEKLLTFFSVKSKEELVNKVYSCDTDRKKIASFSKEVGLSAENGDKISIEILKNQASLFAQTVNALIREMPENPHIALFGGVFENNKMFTEFFKEKISEKYASYEFLKNEAVFGAVLAASEL